MPEANLIAGIFERARQRPEAVAITSPGRDPLCYGEFEQFIQQVMATLRSLGIAGGDRVVVVGSDSAETALACLAVMGAAGCAPLNPDYRAPEYRYFLQALKPKLVLVAQQLDCPAVEVAAELGIPCQRLLAQYSGPSGLFQLDQATMVTELSALPPELPGSEDTALVLHTSGSTSAPKIVALQHRQLAASATHIVNTLGLNEGDCCLSMMPLFHVGGLVDLLLAPLSVGGSVVVAGSNTARTFFDCLEHYRPSWYQGVPTMLQDIVDRAQRDGVRQTSHTLRLVRSVSSPLPAELLTAIESLLQAPIIEMYGMTEAAGQICSNPLPPGKRKPGSVGPPCGVEIRIIDRDGNPTPDGDAGEILLRGDNVIEAYAGGDNQPAFVAGWLRTGDEGYQDPEGYLYLSGRVKDIINRGGEKIAPREIDEVLMQHPQVREAAAFAMPHDSLGEEVAAAIVLEPGATVSDGEVTDFAGSKLAWFKTPRKLLRVAELPRAAGGKLQRYKLAELITEQGTTQVADRYRAPNSELAIELVVMWEEALGVTRISIDDNFFELGGDSLSAASFMEDFETRHQLTLPVTALFDAPTIAEFEALLKGEGFAYDTARSPDPDALSDEVYRALVRRSAAWRGRRASPASLLVGHNTLGARQPIFWSADSDQWIHGFSEHLGADQPVYIMRNTWGMKVFTRKFSLRQGTARHFVREIMQLQPRGPYILGGFCEGAKIAFEAARQLEALGQKITLLCLVEHFVDQPLQAQVAHYLARPNRLSPYHYFEQPEIGWRKLFPGDTGVTEFPWSHDSFTSQAHIAAMARQMRLDIERAQQAQDHLPPPPPLQWLSAEDYRSRVRLKAPAWLEPGSHFSARIQFENRSAVTWQPTAVSGIALYVRWLCRTGAATIQRIAQLDEPMAPGDAVDVSVELQVPADSGRWLLEAGLVDEGVTWFGDRGYGLARKRIYAYRPEHLWQRLRRKRPNA